MKSLLICLSIFFAVGATAQNSCCSTTTAEVAKCTGSAYCRACKSCNYCAHCNSGGSCGVCSPRQVEKTTINTFYSLPDDKTDANYGTSYKIKATALNMRYGPGAEYGVIQKLQSDDALTYLAATGDWIKVKLSTGATGFVHKDYVQRK